MVDRSKDHRDRSVIRVREPTISIHPAEGSEAAVVICPGGGYGGLSWDKEGHDTARWLNSLGITGVVLKYRLKEYGQPAPGHDAQRAISTVRRQADQLGISAHRIGMMGYSAGGHVASTAGTQFCELIIDGQKVSTRPDFMILIYPVISMDESITHQGSRNNLLGKNPSRQLVKRYSGELQVTRQTPPTFLVHAADDRAVPLENSLRLFRALEDAGVPVKFAMYERGGHGFGLVSKPIPAAAWPQLCATWLAEQGIIAP